MALRTTLLTVMLVAAVAVALPVERIDTDAEYIPTYEEDARKDWQQQQLPVASVAQKRDGYGPPAYSPPSYSEPSYSPPSYSEPSYSPPSYSEPTYSEPAYHEPAYKPSGYKPHLPAYIKTYVKTDYHGNVKYGVKHNIAPVGSGYH